MRRNDLGIGKNGPLPYNWMPLTNDPYRSGLR